MSWIVGRRAALGLGGVHHDAAVGQEGGVEQRREDVERERREARDLLGREADAGERHEVPAGVVGEEHHHLLEAERLTDAVADGVEHLLGRVAPRELRGHAQEVLDGGAVAAALGGALGLLEGDRDVRGDGAEQLELDLGGAAAGERLVDRDDAEHLAGRGPQRHHQRVVGMPRARVVDDRDVGRVGPQAVTAPVVLAGGHEVGAVAEEARGDQHVPVRPPRGLAHQQLLRLLVAEHDDDLEVVPGRAVEVDDDRAVAERAGDRGGHGGQHGRERVAGAHGRGDVEQTAQAVEGRGVAEPGESSLTQGVSVSRALERDPDLPQLLIEAPVDRRAQVLDAARAARAGAAADLARRHQRVVEAPALDRLVVVDEQLADLVARGAQRVVLVVAVEVGERGDALRAVLLAERQARARAEALVEPAGRPPRCRGTGATGSPRRARADRGTRGSPRGPSSRARRAGRGRGGRSPRCASATGWRPAGGRRAAPPRPARARGA